MAELIIMPKLGFNMSVGKLVRWHKSEGQEIKKGEAFFSIETDKTNMDIEATNDGFVRKLLIEEGDQVEVTLPIAIVGDQDENIEALIAGAMEKLGKESTSAITSSQEMEALPVTQNDEKKTTVTTPGGKIKISPRARVAVAKKNLDTTRLNIIGTGYQGGICEADILAYCETGSEKISSLARKMAIENGIEKSTLKGTGINGKILKADVEAIANADQSKEQIHIEIEGREILENIPYTGIRRVIGERMSESKFTAPHLYFTKEVDMSKVLETRQQLNRAQSHKISITDFISAATIKALEKFPDINSSLQGDHIIKYKTVNLGIAVAAPSGLIVPVVREAEKKDILCLSEEAARLFERAREGKLLPSEYTGGTFTISNLGMFGIDNFTAIINQPESAILAVSATVKKPVVVSNGNGNDEIVIRPMANITLTVDHRVIDGLMAAQFVVEVKEYLENPVALIL